MARPIIVPFWEVKTILVAARYNAVMARLVAAIERFYGGTVTSQTVDPDGRTRLVLEIDGGIGNVT